MLEMRIAEQTKQEFQFTLSKVSHEIRNPVTLINSYLQLVEKAHPEVEQYEYWEDILDQMDFLKNLLNELSIYNNSGELHRESVPIVPYLKKLTEKLAPTYKYLG
ncbi:MAG: two-component sensor histidine kinase, partial [Lachnospiraceae bacterium]|nr:two-component sensor histidine kinase [Lachnospiraceae bacterium]